MKKIISFLGVALFILLSIPTLAQQLTGESDLFVFDTQSIPAVPLSPWVVIVAMLFIAGMVVFRFFMQKRGISD